MKFEGTQVNIPIKGIMRAGTDNLCADGAMNEVIGMEYKDGSWLPYKTKDKGFHVQVFNDAGTEWVDATEVKKVYVHKTSDGDSHRLFILGGRILVYELLVFPTSPYETIRTIKLTYNVNSVKIVGNLICVATDSGLEYYIWNQQSGNYNVYQTKDLYDSLPKIYFRVGSHVNDHLLKSDGLTGDTLYAKSDFFSGTYITEMSYNYLNTNSDFVKSAATTASKAQFMVAERGRFYGGFLVCAAYRLKSGEYIGATPVLLMNPPSIANGNINIPGGYRAFVPRDALKYMGSPGNLQFNGGVGKTDVWSNSDKPQANHDNTSYNDITFLQDTDDYGNQTFYNVNSLYSMPSMFAYFHCVYPLDDSYLGSVVVGCVSNLLQYKIAEDIPDELEDLIDSVCIFVSDQVSYYKEFKEENTDWIGGRRLSAENSWTGCWGFTMKTNSDFVTELSELKNLYLVHEIPFGRIKNTGSWEVPNLDGKLGDSLYVQPSLPISALVKDSIVTGELDAYNSRIHVYNYTQKTYSGHNVKEYAYTGGIGQYENSSDPPIGNDLVGDFYTEVTIVNRDRTIKVWKYSNRCPDRLNPMITYPNAKAQSIRFYFKPNGSSNWRAGTIPLTPSTNGQFAYFIEPNISDINPLTSGYFSTIYTAPSPIDVNNIESCRNRLKVSSQAFVSYFPLSQTYVIGNLEIIGLAKLTMSLSQDTYGRYPLIIFCKDGIYSLGVDETGNGAYINQPPPLSREVCVNKKTICEIDGAVVFASDKGLMMVTQNGVEEFCPHLNGEIRFSPDESATTPKSGAAIYHKMITEQHLVTLSGALDTQDFIDYLRDNNTVVSYVSKKNKLIVYNKTKPYVYLIDIQTRNATKLHTNIAFDDDNFPEEIYWEIVDATEPNISYITKQFTYHSQDGYVDCLIQSRPVKIQQDDKCSYRVVLTGYFEGQPNDWAGLVVLGSLDANNWRVIGVKEKKLNGGFHNLGCLTERGSWKYLMFIFAGRLSNESHIDSIDITVNGKYNNKKR